MEVLHARVKTTEGWSGQRKAARRVVVFAVGWMVCVSQIPSATPVEKGPSR
ncbi:expressed unknown protein [Ectocarpus siliculosus]|uniref:Uncharacterized protein n=1 Tax=Ectocarpus siliculosus TaxID=2880 RepID=D8LSN3_ECTSI|nr:expressed unknown protein [Ectocarpus siliculosus]|eukprot:CBN77870.1 expressed unknown protein [Ectocarpus siliculosus]